MQPTEVLLLVTDALESLGVIYCVGGSFASSAYGEPRATRDVDILVALPAHKVALFTSRIEADFFVQLADIRDAVALAPSLRNDPLHRATFNRQWADVQSVLVTQGKTLDTTYMRYWATQLAIADLLDAALSGAPPPKLTPPDDHRQMKLDI